MSYLLPIVPTNDKLIVDGEMSPSWTIFFDNLRRDLETVVTDLNNRLEKLSPATEGNLTKLNADGSISDSGIPTTAITEASVAEAVEPAADVELLNEDTADPDYDYLTSPGPGTYLSQLNGYHVLEYLNTIKTDNNTMNGVLTGVITAMKEAGLMED